MPDDAHDDEPSSAPPCTSTVQDSTKWHFPSVGPIFKGLRRRHFVTGKVKAEAKERDLWDLG